MVELSEYYPDCSVEGAKIITQNNQHVIYSFDRKKISASELIRRLSKKYRISDLSVREPEIETTIRRIYEGKLLEM